MVALMVIMQMARGYRYPGHSTRVSQLPGGRDDIVMGSLSGPDSEPCRWSIEKRDKGLIRSGLMKTCLGLLLPAGIMLATCSSGWATANADDSTTTASTSVADMERAAAKFASEVENSRELFSDEFVVQFNEEGSLGLKLVEAFPKGFPVVTVKQITDSALQQQHPELELGAIVTAVGNNKVDGIPLNQIADLVKNSDRPLSMKFRDPNRYFRLLDSTDGPPKRVITTSYLPANTRDAGAPEQVIRVERLEMPAPEGRIRAAQYLDVMEIQYVAQVQSDTDGKIVDSSAERSAPGTSSRSIYYVLGQQNGPPGKFPTGWDLTLRGMVVGEKRRIVLPYTLAYDRKGDQQQGIPPFANLVYTVKLLSLT